MPVVIDGNLACGPRERDGQFSRRIDAPAQDAGQGRGTIDTGLPGLYDGIGQLVHARDFQGAAVGQRHHDGFPRRLQSLQQGFLAPRQRDGGAGSVLSAPVLHLAHAVNDHVTIPGQGDRFGKPVPGFGRDITSLRIAHLGFRKFADDSVQENIHLLWLGMGMPIAAQVGRILGQRAHDGDPGYPSQRQDTVVLQQDHGFGGQFTGRLHRLGKEEALLGLTFRGIRMLEQAQAELDPKHTSHGFVQHTARDFSAFDQLFQVRIVSV